MLKHDELQNRQDVDRPDAAPGGGSTTGFRPPPPSLPRQATPRAHKKTIVGIACAVLIVGSLVVLHYYRATAAKTTVAPGPGGPVIAVVEGTVQQKDVPIYLDGLGTVLAYNTVTVHVRVDGQLQKVAFVEGQDVRTGDMLAQIDPAPFQTQLEQASAKKRQDEAQLANANLDLKRDTDLLAQKIATQQQYDTQKALVDQLAATVKADQAAIDSATVQLDYTTIVSPIDGRTGIRQVDQGNIVHAADVNGLVVITQLRPISLIFTLPEQTLSQIPKEASPNDITVLAVDRDNSTLLGEGKLAVIDNQIDTTTGTIRLKANFPNDDLRLWPGQFVNARLLLNTRKNGLVVPASVIQRGPQGSYAFVIKDDQSVEVRPVKVAQIEKGEALIDEGLQLHERVVVDGQYKLQVGSHVKPTSSENTGDSGS